MVSSEKTKERKIHIALIEDIHQRLRVKCALEGVTMQEYVARLIEKNVEDIHLPSKVTIGKGRMTRQTAKS